MSCHLRSTSLPSRPHFSEIKAEEELHSLKTHFCRQPTSIVTLSDGLRKLAHVYNCVEEIVRLPRNQVDLCLPQQKKMVEKELEQSLVLLDICNAMQENFAELKMSIQELQLVLKRGDMPLPISKLSLSSVQQGICKSISRNTAAKLLLKVSSLSGY